MCDLSGLVIVEKIVFLWAENNRSVTHIVIHSADLILASVFSMRPVPHYWAIQAGLLTPLTFARHRLSPLAAFTSGAYFLHNGRR